MMHFLPSSTFINFGTQATFCRFLAKIRFVFVKLSLELLVFSYRNPSSLLGTDPLINSSVLSASRKEAETKRQKNTTNLLPTFVTLSWITFVLSKQPPLEFTPSKSTREMVDKANFQNFVINKSVF